MQPRLILADCLRITELVRSRSLSHYLRRALWCFLVVILSLVAISRAEGPGKSDLTIAEFPVNKSGDMLTLPVTVGDHTLPFLVDTGASSCSFDEKVSSQFKGGRGSTVVDTFLGTRSEKTFISPPMRIGPLSLGSRSCTVIPALHDNLLGIRQDVYGIIGMDALRDKVFAIDFDNGTFRFLSEAKGDLGAPIPLKWSHGSMCAVVEIEGLGQEECLIATGVCRFSAGCLRKAAFEKLLAQKQLELIRGGGETDAELRGEVVLRSGRIGRLSVGRYSHNGLVFEDTLAGTSTLGLGYLSRFVMTVDAPHSTMYLRPGKSVARLDRYDLSGLKLMQLDASSLDVIDVEPRSSAETAGLHKFDTIISVDGIDANRVSYFKLLRLFTVPGNRRVVFERRGTRMETTVVLRDARGRGVENLRQ